MYLIKKETGEVQTIPNSLDIETFKFRGLHPSISMGTASDRYAGWIGQIYSVGRYENTILRRQHTVGEKSFTEEVLPVKCVQEYFEHFRVLELDFTFYRPLLGADGDPTPNYNTLKTYQNFLNRDDRLILKVPQIIFAQKLRREGKHVENKDYLNPDLFIGQFYEPAVKLLGSLLAGFLFEQEYQRKQDRIPADDLAKQLDNFFTAIPKDDRYHIELRTGPFLAPPIFEVMEKHGVGQVLSHWTWLPSLERQFNISHERFLNSGQQCVVRLLTPLGMKYEDAYAKAHPFNKLVDGMMDMKMVEETAQLMKRAIEKNVHINVIVNNRAGGNAPIISQHIAKSFLDLRKEE